MKCNQLGMYIISCMIIGVSYAEQIPYASQIDQDKVLNEYFFKNKQEGMFIEIGAHNGITYSNTYFFEKALGWKGICLEPMPNEFEKLKVNRTCECINACVSKVEGIVPFVLIDCPRVNTAMLSGMLDTYDPRHLARIKIEIAQYGGSYKIINVPSVRLDTILKDRGITQIDYLFIDTEGSEFDILKTINFDEVQISAISIENNYNDKQMRAFLTSKDFTLVAYFHGYDELYIHNTKMDQLTPIPDHIANLKYIYRFPNPIIWLKDYIIRNLKWLTS